MEWPWPSEGRHRCPVFCSTCLYRDEKTDNAQDADSKMLVDEDSGANPNKSRQGGSQRRRKIISPRTPLQRRQQTPSIAATEDPEWARTQLRHTGHRSCTTRFE
uniref:(northern house mosquito) hypothetical protein n=1 Tax=Culex pipiens TaxID=7175 RepID=A0A8D8A9K7_CULPI